MQIFNFNFSWHCVWSVISSRLRVFICDIIKCCHTSPWLVTAPRTRRWYMGIRWELSIIVFLLLKNIKPLSLTRTPHVGWRFLILKDPTKSQKKSIVCFVFFFSTHKTRDVSQRSSMITTSLVTAFVFQSFWHPRCCSYYNDYYYCNYFLQDRGYSVEAAPLLGCCRTPLRVSSVQVLDRCSQHKPFTDTQNKDSPWFALQKHTY